MSSPSKRVVCLSVSFSWKASNVAPLTSSDLGWVGGVRLGELGYAPALQPGVVVVWAVPGH